MDAKVDYLSFTVMADPRGAGDFQAVADRAVAIIADAHPYFTAHFCDLLDWKVAGARGHYSTSFFQPETYAAIRFGGMANHVLVELPGTACQKLRTMRALDGVVFEAAKRLTRIDVAVDIVTSSSPADFVAAGYNARFKGHASIVSESGTTEYVGSMKSERYARVYKYEPPHPRAGVMRVEHVLRKDFAKAAGVALSESDLLHLAALLGNSFGWQSALWQPDALTDGKLKASRADRHEPGRVRWLYEVVRPALLKADQEGLIDLRDWCAEFLIIKNNAPVI